MQDKCATLPPPRRQWGREVASLLYAQLCNGNVGGDAKQGGGGWFGKLGMEGNLG